MKKKVLTAAIILTLAGTGFSVSANVQQSQAYATNEEIILIEENSSSFATDPSTVGETTPKIHESKIARKMTQAEKAHNAAVNDGWGGAITIIAMCIVIMALVVLSLLFLGFGKISEIVLKSKKRKAKQAADHDMEEDIDLAHGEVIAAISMALTQHFGEGHDIEDTILTIRRMQRAYSPWNSKIYNLRTIGEHVRNPQALTARNSE